MNNTQNNSAVAVVNNQALVEAGLVSAQPSMPAMRQVKRGKGYVNVQGFNGKGQTAAELKSALKAANPKLSAKGLKTLVNETLRGEKSFREQCASAFLQACYQDGYVPTHGECGKATAVIRLAKAPEPKVSAAVAPAAPKTKAEILASIEELTRLAASMA